MQCFRMHVCENLQQPSLGSSRAQNLIVWQAVEKMLPLHPAFHPPLLLLGILENEIHLEATAIPNERNPPLSARFLEVHPVKFDSPRNCNPIQDLASIYR
eukprot:m.267386 g.267386  ORF g.267386 m.267386 type:complete len:100 (-) comp19732_c0_seq15:1539-1838(-)